MICFRLRCGDQHEFEAWFPSASAFDKQVSDSVVSCPECGNRMIEKALMAPAVARNTPASATDMPDQMRAALQRVRSEIETRCDNVGGDFADEALKRHRSRQQEKPLPERGIYGTMSPEDHHRLDDAGVDYMAVPWVRRADA